MEMAHRGTGLGSTGRRDLDQGYANDANQNALENYQVEGIIHIIFNYSLIWCKFRLMM